MVNLTVDSSCSASLYSMIRVTQVILDSFLPSGYKEFKQRKKKSAYKPTPPAVTMVPMPSSNKPNVDHPSFEGTEQSHHGGAAAAEYHFGFTHLEDCEKESLSKITLMVFPCSVWLKKHFTENPVAVQVSDNLLPEPAICSEGRLIGEPRQHYNTEFWL